MHPDILQSSYSTPPAWKHSRRSDRMVSRLATNGFPYSRTLSASQSCVNALAFSSGDGRWLATGGDDLKVYLWDLHQDDLAKPSGMLRGHRGNIFCVEFSASNRYLFSGGIDDLIVQYDITQLGSPLTQHSLSVDTSVFFHHDDNIRGISGHPHKDEIFLSASSDGRVIRHDTRAPPQPRINGRAHRSTHKASDIIQLTHEATDVKYHPTVENLFVTSDSYGDYATRLTRRMNGRLDLSHPEVSSIAFDKEGEKLAVTFLYYLPTIYGLSDPYPLAVCSGQNLPNGRPAKQSDGIYSNACTIKHGTFGSAGLSSDQLYAAGSEDFRGYVWKIPSTSELSQRRTEITPSSWVSGEWLGDTKAFTASSTNTDPIQCVIPTHLSTPLCRLTGHKSIVNSVLIHPQLPCVVSCGVEKNVLLHSASSGAPGAGEYGLRRTSTKVRKLGGDHTGGREDEDMSENSGETTTRDGEDEREARDRDIYLRALANLGPVEDEDGEGEDGETMTIAMFDHILRQEGTGDVFELRRCSAPGDDSSDEDMSVDSDSDGDGMNDF